MEPWKRKFSLRSQENYFYGAHPGMNFKTHSFINVNMNCFCSQYIFLNTIRQTLFQAWSLYHMALLHFAITGDCENLMVHGEQIPFLHPHFLTNNSEVAKLALRKLPKTFTFGPVRKGSFTSEELLSGILQEKSSLPWHSKNIMYVAVPLSP